ncbi:MAG: methyl-accepting chemotaxis protein [Spirochaetales bacterium]|nr:methyl-accepting chemotaxis protein [Spirochaetales bacterium]
MEVKRNSFIRSVGGKILAIFILVSFVSIGSLTIVTILQVSHALQTQEEDKLEAVQMIKKYEIEDYFKELELKLKILKDDPYIFQAISELDNAFEEEGDTINSDRWRKLAKKYDSRMQDIITDFGLDDLLLLHTAGDIVYTVKKNSDLGMIIPESNIANNSLGKAFALIQKSTDKENIIITDFEPYSPKGGEFAAFMIASLVSNQNELYGYVAIQLPTDKINEMMLANTGMGRTGNTYIVGVDADGTTSLRCDRSVKNEKLGDKKTDSIIEKTLFRGEIGQEVMITSGGVKEIVSYDPLAIKGLKWGIFATKTLAEINEPVNDLIGFILIIVVGILILVVIVSILFSKSISKPLLQVVSAGEMIVKGDFPENDIVGKSKDEIGIIIDVFNRIVGTLKAKSAELDKIANGDLSLKVRFESDKDKFANAFDVMVRSLNDILGQVNAAIEQVASGSDQVSKSSQSLSQGASEQAGSLEEISASINEVANQSKQNSENAKQANSLAKKAKENAENGNNRMKELVVSMQKINASSDAIKKIVKIIDDIAFQINLLALNANVEAARAGKYGKGFAVVAEEVRNLAVKSASSVKETTEMVEASIKNIELGNQAATATAEQLEAIVTGASKVADLVEEITIASKEQSIGIEEINSGLDQIDQVTQSNTANAEESASAAEELASQAQQLRALIAQFKLAENGHKKLEKDVRFEVPSELLHKLVHDEIARMKEAGIVHHTPGNGNRSTGVTIVKEKHTKPEDVIALDDDNYGKF